MTRIFLAVLILSLAIATPSWAQKEKEKKASKTEKVAKEKGKKGKADLEESTSPKKEKKGKKKKGDKEKKDKTDYVETVSPSQIEWYPIQKKGNFDLASKVVAEDQSSIYTWQGYDGYYYEPVPILRRFDHKGEMKFESKLPFGEGKMEKAVFVDFIHFNNKLWLVFSLPDKSMKKARIMIQQINKVTGNLIGPAEKIHSVVHTTTKQKGFIPNDFGHRISPDGKRLLILIRDKNSTGKNDFSSKATFVVMNENMAIQWHEPKRRVFRSKDFFVTDFLVSNEGAAFLACQVFEEKGKLTGGHYFQLVAVPDSGKVVRPLDVGYKDMTIIDMSLNFGAKRDQVLATCVYNSSYHLNKAKGVLMLKWNTYHNEMESLLSADFSDQVIATMMDKKKAKKDQEIDQIYLEKIIEDEETLTLFLQRGNRKPIDGRYAMTRLTMLDDSTPEGRSYGNLLVVRLSKKGELMWNHIIRKNLSTNYSQFRAGSFSAFKMGDITRVFYYKGNLAGKGKPVIMASMTEDGKITYEKLFKKNESGYLICPRFFARLSSTELMLYGQSTTRFRQGKLTF